MGACLSAALSLISKSRSTDQITSLNVKNRHFRQFVHGNLWLVLVDSHYGIAG